MLLQLNLAALLAASASAKPLLAYQSQCQGCGKAQTPGYSDTPATIQSGGHSRTFTIQVPEDYDAHGSYPLILDFAPANIFAHGRGGTSATQRDNSLYYDYPSASDYIIVYPQGLTGSDSTSWQGPSYAAPGVDDIEFVSDLLAYLEDNFCIDTNRIYASGKSNGGGFVDTLACSDVGDKFAAFAMAAAALYTDTSLTSCNKKRAILESHGLADHTIPYAGGQGLGGPLPNIDDWVGWWGTRDCGVSASAVSSVEQREGYEVETISCEGGVQDVVKHFRLDSPAAHCWPNAQGDNYDSKRTPDGCGNARMLDFTAEVLKWFGRWDLRSAPQSQ